MPDSSITFTPNLHLTKLPANYRVWAQIMNDNLTLLDSSINGFVQYTNLRGPWSNSTAYAVGDTVVDPLTAVLHTALIAHTSAQIPTTFAEDSLAHPTYWTLANAPATNRGAWTGPGTTYQVNDFVLAEGLKYAMCLIQHVSGASFNADFLLGRWAVLIDLSVAGSLLLPILSGPVDALKFVNTNAGGTAYEIINGTEAMNRLEGILPVVKGGTGVNTSTGTGANVLQGSPAFAGTPTTVTQPLADNSLTIVNSAWVKGQAYAPLSTLTTQYAPINSPTFTGIPAAPTAAPATNTTQLATTAFVAAALASGGASISVGTTPPGSPSANALWWNSDASIGGGQLMIYYNDGSTTQWVPASPSAAALTTPGGDFQATQSVNFSMGAAVETVLFWNTVRSGNSGSWYNPANGRYTPPAGRYRLFGMLMGNNASGMFMYTGFRKNGVGLAPNAQTNAGAGLWGELFHDLIVDANGTDYFDMVGYQGVAGGSFNGTFGAFPLSGIKGPPGDPGVGLLQTVSYQTGAVATGTTIIPFDDTIPQITEGNEYMTLAITPKSATSKLVIDVTAMASTTITALVFTTALFQDSTANALAVSAQIFNGLAGQLNTLTLRHSMTSGTTSSTTFRIRIGGNTASTVTFNGAAGARLYGGALASSIVIQEVL